MFSNSDDKRTAIEILLSGDVGGSIERQEARGQSSFVASATLPKICNNASREQLEALGIVFGKDVDDLFVEVQLPSGWKKEAAGHSMWSNLVDDKGRKRAAIFYKAAFYDRSAHMHLTNRYMATYQPINGYGDNYNPDDPTIGVVTDQGEIIWRTDRQAARKDFKLQDELEKEARAYADAHYPDYRNPMLYWD